MSKFIALIKNETIKLALRGSTMILLIIAIVASAGVCLLFWQESNRTWDWYWDDGWNPMHDMQSQITSLEREQPEGWEDSVAHLRFAIDNGITWDDWRMSYSIMAFEGDWIGGGIGILPAIGADSAVHLANGTENWQAFYRLIIENRTIHLRAAGLSEEEAALSTWFYSYCIENDLSPVEPDWRRNAALTLGSINIQIHHMSGSTGQLQDEDARVLNEIRDQAAILKHRLDNNIERTVQYGNFLNDALMGGYYYGSDSSTTTDVWSMLEACVMMFPFMSVFIIIIAGGMVSSEFSRGTIKFLLINPVKRWKILLSKYIVMLMTGAVFLAAMFGIFFVLGGILTGFTNMNAVHLAVNDGTVTSTPAMLYFLQLWLLGTVNIGVMATLAFSLSALTRNSGLAIAVSIAAVIGGSIIDMILRFAVGVDWGRYLLFVNVNLVEIIHGGDGLIAMMSAYPGQTLAFSIGVIGVHLAIFWLMAWDGFTKKEI